MINSSAIKDLDLLLTSLNENKCVNCKKGIIVSGQTIVSFRNCIVCEGYACLGECQRKHEATHGDQLTPNMWHDNPILLKIWNILVTHKFIKVHHADKIQYRLLKERLFSLLSPSKNPRSPAYFSKPSHNWVILEIPCGSLTTTINMLNQVTEKCAVAFQQVFVASSNLFLFQLAFNQQVSKSINLSALNLILKNNGVEGKFKFVYPKAKMKNWTQLLMQDHITPLITQGQLKQVKKVPPWNYQESKGSVIHQNWSKDHLNGTLLEIQSLNPEIQTFFDYLSSKPTPAECEKWHYSALSEEIQANKSSIVEKEAIEAIKVAEASFNNSKAYRCYSSQKLKVKGGLKKHQQANLEFETDLATLINVNESASELEQVELQQQQLITPPQSRQTKRKGHHSTLAKRKHHRDAMVPEKDEDDDDDDDDAAIGDTLNKKLKKQ